MNIIKNIINTFYQNPKIFVETIILIVLCILIELYYPKFRGFMGEFWVKTQLKRLPKSKYIILNNIMLKDGNGTHQIDHIVLSNYGIFVIETKNYYGLIRGKEFDSKWCQYLGKNKNYFINPIHQNYGHIKTLSSLLNIDEKYFYGVICFSNQAKLNIDCKSIVTQVDYLDSEILKHKDIILQQEIDSIANTIISNNITDKKIRKKHIEDIHTKIKTTKELENDNICPKCGNKLVQRSGKYGIFIGCSNYPKCRYVIKGNYKKC